MTTEAKLITSFLDCLLEYAPWEQQTLYTNIEEFLGRELSFSNVMVISFPKSSINDKSFVAEDACRITWNKKELGFWKEKKRLNRFIKKVHQDLQSRADQDLFILQKTYGVVVCDNDSQVYLLIGTKNSKNSTKISQRIWRYLGTLVKAHSALQKRVQKLESVSAMVYSDDVTSLYNQRKLQIDISDLVSMYERHKETFTLLFIDIDHFKNVNDGHGHLIGTLLLKEMAGILKKVLRESDLIYRYGGDEFVMVVPNSDSKMARLIGERILHTIKAHNFKIKNVDTFKLSVSIGIAEFPKDAKTSEEVLEIADKMMYKAKVHGRGQVCLADEFFT